AGAGDDAGLAHIGDADRDLLLQPDRLSSGEATRLSGGRRRLGAQDDSQPRGAGHQVSLAQFNPGGGANLTISLVVFEVSQRADGQVVSNRAGGALVVADPHLALDDRMGD